MKNLENKFNEKFGDFYVPDNAEVESEWVDFADMKQLCEDEWNTSKTLQEKFCSGSDLLDYMIHFIEWEFPSTFIEDLKNFD